MSFTYQGKIPKAPTWSNTFSMIRSCLISWFFSALSEHLLSCINTWMVRLCQISLINPGLGESNWHLCLLPWHYTCIPKKRGIGQQDGSSFQPHISGISSRNVLHLRALPITKHKVNIIISLNICRSWGGISEKHLMPTRCLLNLPVHTLTLQLLCVQWLLQTTENIQVNNLKV